MSKAGSTNQAQFFRKRGFRLPWQEAQVPIERAQAKDVVKQGNLLGKESSTSITLPIKTATDLDEFESFQDGVVRKSLTHKDLAGDILTLRKLGLNFSAWREPKENEYVDWIDNEGKKDIGAYGAYNMITEGLELGQLRVAFHPKAYGFGPSNLQEFRELRQAAEKAQEVASTTDSKYRKLHREILTSVFQKIPHHANSTELALATAQKLGYGAWPQKGADQGLVGYVFRDVPEFHPRRDLVTEITSQLDQDGKKMLSSSWRAVALYEAALEKDDKAFCKTMMKKTITQDYWETPEDDVQEDIMTTERREVSFLASSLAKALFPKKATLAESLTSDLKVPNKEELTGRVLAKLFENPQADQKIDMIRVAGEFLSRGLDAENLLAFWKQAAKTSKTNPRAQIAVALLDPNRRDRPEMDTAFLKFSFNSELSQEEFIDGLFDRGLEQQPQLVDQLIKRDTPKRAKLVETWVDSSAEPQKQADQTFLLQLAAYLNPDIDEPFALLEELQPSSLSNDKIAETLNDLWANLLKTQNLSAPNKVAMELLQSPDLNSDTKELLREAGDSSSNLVQFMNRSVSSTKGEDKKLVRDQLLTHFPKRAAVIRELIEFSDFENKSFHYQKLGDAAALAMRDETPTEMVLRAVESLDENQRDFFERASGLYRLAAKIEAKTNERSRLILETADAGDVDGGREIESFQNSAILYRAALDKKTRDMDLFNRIIDQMERYGRSFTLLNLGPKLFPELDAKVKELTQYSSAEDASLHWGLLFNAAVLQPQLNEPRELVKSALSFAGPSLRRENDMNALALKKLSKREARARLALNLVMDEKGQAQITEPKTIASIYTNALEPGLSETDFLVNVVEGAHPGYKDELFQLLGKQMLEESQAKLPPELQQRFLDGELSLTEFAEIYETLNPQGSSGPTEIEIEDELILIGDETLEVDL